MAEAATIARPYAKAAFMSARDARALPSWSAALAAGTLLVTDSRIAAWLTSPRLSVAQVASMFSGLGGAAAAADFDAHWQNFVRLLTANKRWDVLPQITRQFGILRAEYENELDVEVTSAVPMSDAQCAQLAAALKTRFKRQVRMTASVDPALLGGAIIRAGDLVIDGSINGRLQRMAAELA